VIYWGDAGGAVRSHVRVTTSVYFDGTRVLWTDCGSSGNQCSVRKRQGGTTTIVSSGGVGAGNVQGDATAMFWGDHSVRKYVH
jgi:hypothetical protein